MNFSRGRWLRGICPTVVPAWSTRAKLPANCSCLTVRISDLPRDWWPPREKLRLRILEGIPVRTGEQGTFWGFGPLTSGDKGPAIGAVVARRFLGEFDIEEDGSFQAEVPADIPWNFN